MAGFDNDVMYADNVDFSGGYPVTGKVTTDGQLLIGNTAGPNIQVGNITSTTLTIGYSVPDITIETMGGGEPIERVFVDDTSGTGTNPVLPLTGDISILGRSGSKTISEEPHKLTVKSPPYSDVGGSTTVQLNTGSFATAAITLTTPAAGTLSDGDLLEFVATNGILIIDLAGTQVAHLGSLSTSAGGTITSTSTGDSVSLRWQSSTQDWWATSIVGTFVLA